MPSAAEHRTKACSVCWYVGGGDRRRRGARRTDRPVAGARGQRGHRYHHNIHRLHPRSDAVGDRPDPVRRSLDHRIPDHLHGAGAGRLSPGLGNRNAGPISGEDRDGSAGGVRRRWPGAVPAGAVSRVSVGGGDLDAAREPRRDLQHVVAKSQASRRRLRGHGRCQRTWSAVGAAAGDATVAGLVGVVAAIVWAYRRPSRGCTSISGAGTATRSCATRADGLPDRR
ncbi:Uncharacterised protein [Mycobacterium tuberculosis]|nr:Uncharacterised protein [Mycobacterium tuberculosis]CNV68679.1 Uncharacterised protein [Mycobacterium tuberculosis]